MIPGFEERDAPQRHLATAALLLIGLVCVSGFMWMVYALPFWIAFPAGLVLIAAGVGLALSVVDRIVAKKIKAPSSRFGDE